jgi:hypothetical protein
MMFAIASAQIKLVPALVSPFFGETGRGLLVTAPVSG